MSTEKFIDTLVPKMAGLADDFIQADGRDQMQTLSKLLNETRSNMAISFQKASNKALSASMQQIYDASSALERQLSVMMSSRREYFQTSVAQRAQSAKYLRSLASSTKKFLDANDPSRESLTGVDEPYLDATGEIVVDSE